MLLKHEEERKILLDQVKKLEEEQKGNDQAVIETYGNVTKARKAHMNNDSRAEFLMLERERIRRELPIAKKDLHTFYSNPHYEEPKWGLEAEGYDKRIYCNLSVPKDLPDGAEEIYQRYVTKVNAMLEEMVKEINALPSTG